MIWCQEYIPHELAHKLIRPVGKLVCQRLMIGVPFFVQPSAFLVPSQPGSARTHGLSLGVRAPVFRPDEGRAALQLGSVATAKAVDGQLHFEQAVKERFDKRCVTDAKPVRTHSIQVSYRALP